MSRHFTLHKLSDNVQAAIATDGGAAICNAGIINLGKQILVFDTFLTSMAARDLLQACLELFGRKPSLIINSHYHNDHTWGNQVFRPEAEILSTSRTRELLMTAGKEEVQYYAEHSAGELESVRERYRKAKDEDQRNQIAMWMGYYEGLVEAMPNLEVCLPTVTFESQLELHGVKGKAILIPFEKAHTQGDAVLYLPEERILFASDLVFIGCHPYLGDGNPSGLLHTLETLNQLGATRIIPGHGEPGTSHDVQLMSEYVQSCMETAEGICREGEGYEARIKNLKPAGRFSGWRFETFFQANIRFLCQIIAREGAGEKGA